MDLNRHAGNGALHVVRGENLSKIFMVAQQHVESLLARAIRRQPEGLSGHRVEPSYPAIAARRYDGVGRGVHNGMIAGILTVAQHAFSCDRNRDVRYLQYAVRNPFAEEGTHDDIVDEVLSDFVSKRKQRV